MSSHGWIKLHRKSLDSESFNDPIEWRFWCWCLLSASHKAKTVREFGNPINLMPGQFIMGRRSASRELGISEQSIRTLILSLKKSGNISTNPTNKYTIVTVMNWDLYQDQAEESTSNQPTHQPATNPQINPQINPHSNPHSNHNQELKKERIKEYNKEYIVHPDGLNDEGAYLENLPVELSKDPGQVELSEKTGQLPGGLIKPSGCRLPMQQVREQADLFSVWYARYPRKVGRKPAWEKWLRIKPLPTKDDLVRMLEVLEHQSRSEQWQESVKLIPLPETYISKERWDEVINERQEGGLRF